MNLRQRPFEPGPNPGLRFENFRKTSLNGFGDRYNAFAHSMAWFDGHLYVGTTRANFQTARAFESTVSRGAMLECWPVDGPDTIEGAYRELDRRAQIWRYNPQMNVWTMAFRSPEFLGEDGFNIPREVGYRGMVVFQGESDNKPTLYVPTWAPSKVEKGSIILRSEDGLNFEEVADSRLISGGTRFPTQRAALVFKDLVFMAPAGGADGNINKTTKPSIFFTRDPVKGPWQSACEPGFGDETNRSIFMACASNEHVYAGTFNLEGYQVWQSDCTGDPPFRWKKLLDKGAYRGPFNQIAMSLTFFKGALYVGSSIQGAGFDSENNIGPAAIEIVRVFPDGHWDLLVGEKRQTPDGLKRPLSFLRPGFGNFFNGYSWRSIVHDGWLYQSTCNLNSLLLYWVSRDAVKPRARQLLEKIKFENILANKTGAELWRTADGENWLPVNQRGFNNPYNIGFRNLASTPYGLFVGTANPFGPRIGIKRQGQWIYTDNPAGGLEVWQGSLEFNSTNERSRLQTPDP